MGKFRDPGRNRTGVTGFADQCMTSLPRGQNLSRIVSFSALKSNFYPYKKGSITQLCQMTLLCADPLVLWHHCRHCLRLSLTWTKPASDKMRTQKMGPTTVAHPNVLYTKRPITFATPSSLIACGQPWVRRKTRPARKTPVPSVLLNVPFCIPTSFSDANVL